MVRTCSRGRELSAPWVRVDYRRMDVAYVPRHSAATERVAGNSYGAPRCVSKPCDYESTHSLPGSGKSSMAGSEEYQYSSVVSSIEANTSSLK